ncbi:hypothetical protein FRC00_003068 [Tulasnella sp. 408]|nr:hypothetical protein FRC00_003068 [Tulasnella sp. 408]
MSTQSSASKELVFYGRDGIEAEEFIRSVLKAAKAAGRLRDDRWILDEVYVAFAGDALRWYIELDAETRNDWLRLQRAVMQQYPPPSRRSWSGSDHSATRPLIIPIPAAAAPSLSSFPLMGASKKYFYIRAMRQDAAKTLYVGTKDEDVVLVTSRDDAIMVRHDRQSKELRLIHTNGHQDQGEKLEIRRDRAMLFQFGASGPQVKAAQLQLLDAEGKPKGARPILSGDSLTSWNMTDENSLQAIPQDGSKYSIKLYLGPLDDDEGYPLINAYMGNPTDRSASSLHFLTLKLEEI